MSNNRKEVLIILCRIVGYFLRDTVEFSRKNMFRVYLTVSNSQKNTFNVYKSILRERLFALAPIGLYLICVVIIMGYSLLRRGLWADLFSFSHLSGSFYYC